MSEITADQLAQRIYEARLLETPDIERVMASVGGRTASLDSFVTAMLQEGLLTNWQISRLAEGNRGGYFYGKWKVLYLVGAGTFARVYRAEHRETREQKAVKVLRNRYSDDDAMRERFIREARTVMELRHPNIVPIYEVEVEHGRCYMVMDFVEGQNLRDYVTAHGKLKLVVALEIARDLAAGLDHALKKGVSHRDMKLSNVLLSARGQAKLVDFGLAGVHGAADDEEAVDGTFGPRSVDYAGLEKMTNVPRNDRRSDIYFLGCMLYQMIAGVPPLVETRERMKRMSPRRFREVAPITNHVANLPHRVVIVVSRLMDLNPEARVQSPGQALTELENVLEGVRSGKEQVYDETLSAQQAEDYARQMGQLDEGRDRTVMIVDNNVKVQDLFREKLKEVGYRVLILSNPRMALERFRDLDPAEPRPADVVIFGCSKLGMTAVEAFNQFFDEPGTGQIPALLMIEEEQRPLLARAQLEGPRRGSIVLPAKFKAIRGQLRGLVDQLREHDRKLQ